MSRGSMDMKACRYLVEGWLSIEHADAETVRASVRGSDAVYLVGYCGGVWACNCQARGRCAHVVAVGLVGAEAGSVSAARLVADVRQKLADAREECIQFGERFEHLVEVGRLDRARVAHRSGEERHSVDEFAEDLDRPDDVRLEPKDSALEVVCSHGRRLVYLALGVNRARRDNVL